MLRSRRTVIRPLFVRFLRIFQKEVDRGEPDHEVHRGSHERTSPSYTVILLDSHDGTSVYQLRVGLFRVVCNEEAHRLRGCLPDLVRDASAMWSRTSSPLQITERFRFDTQEQEEIRRAFRS